MLELLVYVRSVSERTAHVPYIKRAQWYTRPWRYVLLIGSHELVLLCCPGC